MERPRVNTGPCMTSWDAYHVRERHGMPYWHKYQGRHERILARVRERIGSRRRLRRVS